MAGQKNRRFVLAERPKGLPTQDTLRLEEVDIPAPAEGEIVLKTLYLSLDPYMRGRMNDAPSYSPPVPIGGVMDGGTVGKVIASRAADFAEGDIVVGYGGWQEYATLKRTRRERSIPRSHRSQQRLACLACRATPLMRA